MDACSRSAGRGDGRTNLGGELLAGRLAAGGLAGGLLGTGHLGFEPGFVCGVWGTGRRRTVTVGREVGRVGRDFIGAGWAGETWPESASVDVSEED
jgi:hypothetical protein